MANSGFTYLPSNLLGFFSRLSLTLPARVTLSLFDARRDSETRVGRNLIKQSSYATGDLWTAQQQMLITRNSQAVLSADNASRKGTVYEPGVI